MGKQGNQGGKIRQKSEHHEFKNKNKKKLSLLPCHFIALHLNHSATWIPIRAKRKERAVQLGHFDRKRKKKKKKKERKMKNEK